MARYLVQVQRDFGAEALKFTGTTLSYDESGRHYRVWIDMGGLKRFVVFPRTPSDHRGHLNSLSFFRRVLREMKNECDRNPQGAA